MQCPDAVEHDVTQSPSDPFSEKTIYEDNLFGKVLIAYFTKKISEEVGANFLKQWFCMINSMMAMLSHLLQVLQCIGPRHWSYF